MLKSLVVEYNSNARTLMMYQKQERYDLKKRQKKAEYVAIYLDILHKIEDMIAKYLENDDIKGTGIAVAYGCDFPIKNASFANAPEGESYHAVIYRFTINTGVELIEIE